MHRRLWVSIAATAIGAALLVAAGFASPAKSSTRSPSGANSTFVGGKKGGTLRLNMSASDVDYIDPALAYYQLSWDILYITCRPLLNYPDKPSPAGVRLFPDGATSFPKVSQGGTLYTFTVRKGMKFSNGVPITAKNYKAAFDRDAITDQKGFGPTGPFIGDIKGANGVVNGKGKAVSGVTASGQTLRIKLTHQAPDFTARTAMLFFCPIPAPGQSGYPKISEAGVNTFAGSGPYYVASRTPNGPILIKTNKFYRGNRPHNASSIAIQTQTNLDTSLSQVKRGDINYDMGGLPPAAHASLARQYGINKSRYFVHPTIATRYLALNNQRLFGSTKLRKAANFALDRKGMINLRGAYAGHATDQLLPPNLRGFRNSNVFPFRPNIPQARKVAGGGSHNATMYTSVSTIGANQGALVQADFKLIGINVDVQKFSTSTMYKKCGTKSEAFDICNVGWIADYPDPYDFINVLLSKDSIHDSGNNNYSYFSNLKYTRMMNAAARLVGPKRYSTYGNLDVQITKDAAPIAAWDNDNDREFISAKTGCYTNQPVYGLADLSLLCVK
jgi:peptide/nickel transport system substrate-binding protein